MFDFVNEFFFSKYSADSSKSENPIDFFHPLVVAPENKFKVKKMIKKRLFFLFTRVVAPKDGPKWVLNLKNFVVSSG